MLPAMRRACLLLLLATACVPAKRAAPLRPERLDWNGVRASWRDFPAGGICDAEPRFLLDELLSVNELLKRFLKDTEGEADAPWPDSQMALIDEGRERLPPVMDAHEQNLDQLERCAFRDGQGYPLVRRNGRQFIERTRRWLDEAPRVIAQVKRQRAREAWERERLATQEGARRTCPSARLGAATIYFAFRDDEGRTSFYFCDGASVLAREGAQPVFEPAPAELGRGKRTPEKTYLTAAQRYPKEAILTPP